MENLIVDIYNIIFSHLNDVDIVNFQSTCNKLNRIFYPLFYNEFVEMEYFNVIPNYILVSEHKNKNLIKYAKYFKCIFDFTDNLTCKSPEISLLNYVKSAIISNTSDNLEVYCPELVSLIINETCENLKIYAPKLKELYISHNKNIESIQIISPKLVTLSCYSPKYLNVCLECKLLKNLRIYGEIDKNDIVNDNLNLYICIDPINAHNIPDNIKKIYLPYDIEILNMEILKTNYMIEVGLLKYNYLNDKYIKREYKPCHDNLFTYELTENYKIDNKVLKIPIKVINCYPSHKYIGRQHCVITDELNIQICYNDLKYQGNKFMTMGSELLFKLKNIEALNISSKKSKLEFTKCFIKKLTINQIVDSNCKYGLIVDFQNTYTFDNCDINTCYIDGYHSIIITNSSIDKLEIIHFQFPDFRNEMDSYIYLKNSSIRKLTLYRTKLICDTNSKITILKIDNYQRINNKENIKKIIYLD